MKKISTIAWLLVLAILTMTGTALGESFDIELSEGNGLQNELTIDMDVDVLEDELSIAGDDGLEDGLTLDLSEFPLEGNLPGENAAAADGAAVASNGNADSGRIICLQPGEGAGNDELFADYVDMLFGRVPQKNGYIGRTLTGTAKKMYDYLALRIEKVAAGKISSSVFRIPASYTPDFDWDTYWNDIVNTFYALLADCPYHLYWFDKVRGISPIFEDGQLILPFTVAEEYAKDTFETDAARIGKAQIAVKNARKVVKRYAGISDYRKLCGYRDYICNAVEYNDAAVEDPATPYGNPWQLIWAFDDDPSTNIVCEGYSKSFQYLCDLSSFNDGIKCYSVAGDGGNNPDDWGAHMWNIVTMENGRNYHVDITFCDTGLPEDFLVGTPDAAESGGAFYTVNGEACYHFGQETLATFPQKVLMLSDNDYNPDKPEPTAITITQGKSATAYMGNTLVLKTKMTPRNAEKVLTWTSSKPDVATVSSNGTVIPKKAGKTVVTVKTKNGLSAKITVRVIDAGSIKFKEGTRKTIAIYKTATLHIVVSPSKVKPRLTWTSSNPKVATVSKRGVIKGVGYGTATITATTANGKTAKITVRVVDAKPESVYRIKETPRDAQM